MAANLSRFYKRNRRRDYEVSFERGGVAWLLDAVEVVLRDEGRGKFFRKLRGSSYLLLLEVTYNNRRGGDSCSWLNYRMV